MKKYLALLPLLVFLVAACNKKADFDFYYYTDEDYKTISQYLTLPNNQVDYSFNLPAHLGNIQVPVDNKKALLGRVLFYDKNLSVDGTISCASCHKQGLGFSDDVAFSNGVNGNVTARNSLALSSVTSFASDYGTDLNGTGALRFFWDNRAATASEQSRGSLTNPREMGMNMHDVAVKVGSLPYYRPLVMKAFETEYIDEDQVLSAIESFVNTLGSFNSKFDTEANNGSISFSQGVLQFDKPFLGFSSAENRGKEIYNQFCSSCHSGDFSRPVLAAANNGLDEDTSTDEGVGGITGRAQDMGCFKVPNLRNIALTAPYMHDGRFKTLEEVVEHYSSGIKVHPNLDTRLRDPEHPDQPLRMNLSTQDKYDLVQFLNTLTDNTVATMERFSDPFKH